MTRLVAPPWSLLPEQQINLALADPPAIKHGTHVGYRAESKAGLPTCAPCRAAAAAYERGRVKEAALRMPPRLIDATGFRRRAQALYALGWDWPHQGAQLGMDQRNLSSVITRNQYVTRARHAAMLALYARWCMRTGPSDKARRHAQRRGWAPPLAWDDDGPHGIDDPQGVPHRPTIRQPRAAARPTRSVDPIAVARALAGDPPTHGLTPAELEQVACALHDRGHTDAEAAAVLRVTSEAVRVARTRARGRVA